MPPPLISTQRQRLMAGRPPMWRKMEKELDRLATRSTAGKLAARRRKRVSEAGEKRRASSYWVSVRPSRLTDLHLVDHRRGNVMIGEACGSSLSLSVSMSMMNDWSSADSAMIEVSRKRTARNTP